MGFLLVAVAALAVVIGCSVLSRRTGIAAPLLLLVLGIGGSFIPGVPQVLIEPEWILAGVLPPLLYSSAVRLPVMDLRRNLGMIMWLSVLLVIISAVAVGYTVHAIFPQIPVPLGVALGAVVSPTDAVAATAVGKRLGLPHRLMTILEGESLVNDASALVLLRSALAALAGSFSFWRSVGDFVVAVVVAIVVGIVIGVITVFARAKLSDPVLNTTISFFVPFLAYFPAEELHGSGVLATVVAGLLTGHQGARRFSAASRSVDAANWSTVNFLLESLLFLAMGLELPTLLRAAREETGIGEVVLIAGSVLVLLVLLRGVGVLVPMWISTRPRRADRALERITAVESWLTDFEVGTPREQQRADSARRAVDRSRADLAFEENEPIGRRGAVVLVWAGMRGVVTLAASQTIPEGTALRSEVVLIAFVVAVATLIGFGTTLPAVIRWAQFEDASAEDKRQEFQSLFTAVTEAAVQELGPLEEQSIDGVPLAPAVMERIRSFVRPLTRLVGQSTTSVSDRDQMSTMLRRYVDSLRAALLDERAIGNYRTETYLQVQSLIDQIERRLEPPV